MNQVMKVSKAGNDVLSTGDANLTFGSSLATHSIFYHQIVNKPVNTQTATITHNLGFVPKAWVAAINLDSRLQRLPIIAISTRGKVDFKITSSQLIISTDSSGGYFSNSIDFYVIIFTRTFNP